MAQAIEITAVLVSAKCPCGGMVLDNETMSYDIVPGSTDLICEDCNAKIKLTRKTARL